MTSQVVKDRLLELGTVDLNGINMNEMHDLNPPWWHTLLGCDERQQHQPGKCAVVLDMGQYVWSCTKQLPQPFSSASLASASMARHGTSFRSTSLSSNHTTPPAILEATGEVVDGLPPAAQRPLETVTPSGTGPGGLNSIHLFQILPPKLAERARVFGCKVCRVVLHFTLQGLCTVYCAASCVRLNAALLHRELTCSGMAVAHCSLAAPLLLCFHEAPKQHGFVSCPCGLQLAMKEEWVRVRPAYFEAPGAAHAPIGENAEQSQLPPITMVFCIVDGGSHRSIV